jgi:hypothetical protein
LGVQWLEYAVVNRGFEVEVLVLNFAILRSCGGKAVRGGNYPIGTIDFRDISPSVWRMEVNARYLNALDARSGLIT